MKATGIVRRLDDLGRLVIPKEIRRLYKFKEGDSIELFVGDNSEIILKKYSMLNEEEAFITNMCRCLSELDDHDAMFLTDDKLIGNEKYDFNDLTKDFISKTKTYRSEEFSKINVTKEGNSYNNGYNSPVIVDSHFIGCFIMLADHPINIECKKVCDSFANLLTISSQQ